MECFESNLTLDISTLEMTLSDFSIKLRLIPSKVRS